MHCLSVATLHNYLCAVAKSESTATHDHFMSNSIIGAAVTDNQQQIAHAVAGGGSRRQSDMLLRSVAQPTRLRAPLRSQDCFFLLRKIQVFM